MNNSLSWNSGLTAQAHDDYQAPPIGEYVFKIVKLDKTYSKSGDPMAKLQLQLEAPGNPTVFDYLVLRESLAWKLCSFFVSVGLMEPGEDLAKMPWDEVEGARGRCKIKHEEYNGKVQPKIDQYLPRPVTTQQAIVDPDQIPGQISIGDHGIV